MPYPPRRPPSYCVLWMLGHIRQLADRVRRRDRIALLLVGLCSAFGLAMGFTGGRAFLEQPCSTFHRPVSSESRCVDQIAAVSALPIEPPAPTTPPRSEPPPALEREVVSAPGPLGWLCDAPPVSLRGPPPSAARAIDLPTDSWRTRGDTWLHMMRRTSGSS
jgi:hypothetical protein